jgi:hypothetical protein
MHDDFLVLPHRLRRRRRRTNLFLTTFYGRTDTIGMRMRMR